MCGPIEHPDICESMPAVGSSFWPLGSQELLSGPNGEGKRSRCQYRELDLNPQEQKDFFFLVKKFLSWCQKGSDELPTSSCPFFLSYLPPPARSSHVQTQADGAGALAVALPTRADYGTHPSPSWSLENS